MVLQHVVPGMGYHQGLILKEWYAPLRDKGIKTYGKVWRAVIAWKWNDPEAHEKAWSLAKLLEQLDVCLVGVQRLSPSKDWKAIRKAADIACWAFALNNRSVHRYLYVYLKVFFQR